MKKISLLLVDDEKEFLEATARVLERRGFEVTKAENGTQALVKIDEARPDLVVLDLRMEGMDGIATLKEIRRLEPELPAIILTGHGTYHDAVAGIKLEIVDFLQKPVDVVQLAHMIRHRLDGAQSEQGALREQSIRELMAPADAFRRVYTDQTVRDVVEILRTSIFQRRSGKVTEPNFYSVLVYGRDETFAGIIRIEDVLRSVVPAFLRASPYSSYFTGMFLAQTKVAGNGPLDDLIDRVHRVQADAPLMEAIHLLESERLRNVPVFDGDKIVGVIRSEDVLLTVAFNIIGG